MIFNGRVKVRMSDDQPIILRLPKCPSCGSFNIDLWGIVDDHFAWRCFDCGHRRGDPPRNSRLCAQCSYHIRPDEGPPCVACVECVHGSNFSTF